MSGWHGAQAQVLINPYPHKQESSKVIERLKRKVVIPTPMNKVLAPDEGILSPPVEMQEKSVTAFDMMMAEREALGGAPLEEADKVMPRILKARAIVESDDSAQKDPGQLVIDPDVHAMKTEEIIWNDPASPTQSAEAAEARDGVHAMQIEAMPVSHKWVGSQGTALQTVLETWSAAEGVTFYWHAPTAVYFLRKPFSLQGDYTEAVAVLLDQFQQVRPRPIANLHVDPRGEKKSLVITIDTP